MCVALQKTQLSVNHGTAVPNGRGVPVLLWHRSHHLFPYGHGTRLQLRPLAFPRALLPSARVAGEKNRAEAEKSKEKEKSGG